MFKDKHARKTIGELECEIISLRCEIISLRQELRKVDSVPSEKQYYSSRALWMTGEHFTAADWLGRFQEIYDHLGVERIGPTISPILNKRAKSE